MADTTQQTIQARRDMQNRIANAAQRMIWVTFAREGIHRYPAAGTNPELADVAFLANDHRHMFHFKIHVEVFHNDRELEFIQVKRWVESLFDTGVLQLDSRSCEMISDDLYHHISERYPFRDIWITVSEDHENGTDIKYLKTFNTQ